MSQEESQEGQPGVPPREELEGRLDAAQRELAELRRRMDEIKGELAADVDRQWVSPWRTPETFEVKVSARLSGHAEYRSLVGRVREVERERTALVAELDRVVEEGSP